MQISVLPQATNRQCRTACEPAHCAILVALVAWLTTSPIGRGADVILNEYNAVDDVFFLEDDGEDTFWGRTLGNGNDWFELVVITDHLDMRDWSLVLSDEVGEDIVLTLTQHEAWSDLRRGTIITVSEELGNNADHYNPAVGQWWINVKAAEGTAGTYITPANFRVNENNWQLTILDAAGGVVFGPAGEGVNPTSGVNSQEVFKLEDNPGAAIAPSSNYADGQTSTFGAPNVWNGGASVQDFSELRSVVRYFPLTSIRLNEVLSHTDAPEGDWIELYNTTDETVDIGGWYLSDDDEDLTRFQIPAEAVVPARGFLVIGQSELNFALSATRGEELFLSQTDDNRVMTGGRDFISFGAASNGVTFGRQPDGTGSLYLLVAPTLGAANAEPLVGPVVINEIMYQPIDGKQAPNGTDLEFVEIMNLTDESALLSTHFADVRETHPWRLAGGVQFAFSVDTRIPACGHLLVVGFDPASDAERLAAFRAAYELGEAIQIVGPYEGALGNLGETVRLEKPDEPQGPDDPDAGLVPYVLVDEVPYTNRLPWPTAAAGTGSSLERVDPREVGNDPANWAASELAGGTPGSDNSVSTLLAPCGPDGAEVGEDPDGDESGPAAPRCGPVSVASLLLVAVGLMTIRWHSSYRRALSEL